MAREPRRVQVEVVGYLSFRQILGKRTVELDEGATLAMLFEKLVRELEEDGASKLFDAPSGLRPQLVVLVNGRPLRLLRLGSDTPLAQGDTVAVFPPSAGG